MDVELAARCGSRWTLLAAASPKLARGRSYRAPSQSPLAALSGMAWQVYIGLHGAFTLASLAGTALSAVAAVLGLVALPEARAVAAARPRQLSEPD